MTSEASKPISAFHEILKWAVSRPLWQQDALRRIVVEGDLKDTDLKDFDRLCRAKHQIDASPEPALKAEPIAKQHIPSESGSETAVTIESLANLKHVNRLPSDQTVSFRSPLGLTVIYGDNGSGKSGYARVIKKACRARGVPPVIRSNAFSKTPEGPASATIEIQVLGSKFRINWTDGVVSDPRLGNVFVFDSFSAEHYLQEDSPTTFTPSGLDILPALSKACDAVRACIQEDIDKTIDAISSATKNWSYLSSTEVGRLIGSLSATTDTVKLDALAGLDEKQAKRLMDLSEALKANPKQKAKETRAAAARLKVFAERVTSIAANLADENIENIRIKMEDAKIKADTAKSFASQKFDSTYLPGSGGELWRKMWNGASIYSTSLAYEGQKFPFIEANARCVFCQQFLDPNSIKRLKAFDDFCRDQSQQLAEEAAKHLKDKKDQVEKINGLGTEFDRVKADLSSSLSPEQCAAVSDFVKAADERLATVKDNLVKSLWVVPISIPTSPAAIITATEGQFEARAKTEESADNPETRKALESERDELQAREWLNGIKADVLKQIEKYNFIEKLKECQKDTSTTPITTKSTELTKLLVTEAFRNQFKKEIASLGLRTLNVTLEEIKGKKAETSFGLRLVGSTDPKVFEIASEGEKRCIALAAFLAELSQASHNSALVFDDPVSSLDHWHRERIAARLVEESRTRQVILFTHDVVFLQDLLGFSEEANLTPEIMCLEWANGLPGKCVQGLPWDCMPPGQRLQELRKEQKGIAESWNPQPNHENVQAMRNAYTRLRKTLERIVEKELLADIVSRSKLRIATDSIKYVAEIPQSECNEASRLIEHCHEHAHEPAPGKNSIVPTPDEFENDIVATEKLLAAIRTRRKTQK